MVYEERNGLGQIRKKYTQDPFVRSRIRDLIVDTD